MRSSNCPHVLALLMCFMLTAPLIACDKSKEKETPSEDTKKAQEKDSEAEARARERADAFGLPLPPRVLTIQRNERQIKLTTDMTLRGDRKSVV